jgi:aldehyde:ferredoxin oxidoreductase
MFGYMGKILRVNLSKSKITEEALDENAVRMFLGGSGLGTKYLFDEVKKGIDPLGPENKLIFMTGPLTGTPAPSSGRYTVVAKSPQTGFWGQANSAGFWGAGFKRSGFDGVIFEGISPKPVYLVTEDGKAELGDAKSFWGKNTSETTKLIKEELGEKFLVTCIGIAGEKLVRFASIINDADHPYWGRAAGRCGMGTVMGSKRLKAIASRGTMKITMANEETFKEEAKTKQSYCREGIVKQTIGQYGTAAAVDMVAQRGGFPTRNWQTAVFPNSEKINASELNERILAKRKGCFSCAVDCGPVSDIKTGPFASTGEGPEYESIGSFGGMCDIDNLEAITHAHFLCNEYGLDTISTGSTIAFAMECYERGVLTKKDTDGLEVKFGDPDVMIKLLHKIGRREGIGNLLAEGTRIASEKLGKGTDRFAMNVKGLELAGYDPRAAKIMGLAFATANRGGCHCTSQAYGPAFMVLPYLIVEDTDVGDILQEIPGTAKVVKDLEDALAVFDADGGCKFTSWVTTPDDWATLISCLTGWEFTASDYRKTGERIYNLERAYSIREGLTRADDTLPKRLLEDPLPEGPAKGQVVHLEPLLDAYYGFRGWDGNGKPTPEKLKELGLDWVIKKIY